MQGFPQTVWSDVKAWALVALIGVALIATMEAACDGAALLLSAHPEWRWVPPASHSLMPAGGGVRECCGD